MVESQNFPVTYTAVDLITPSAPVVTEAPFKQLPLSLTIPSIGVLAKVQSVGLTSTGEMAPPSNFFDVAWYEGGTVPGDSGSAVIAGHLSGKYIPEAVFYNLVKLAPGDHIFVTTESGSSLTFKVSAVKSYRHTDSSNEVFFSDNGVAMLNLITCGGSWLPAINLFEERIVVFSELVNNE